MASHIWNEVVTSAIAQDKNKAWSTKYNQWRCWLGYSRISRRVYMMALWLVESFVLITTPLTSVGSVIVVSREGCTWWLYGWLRALSLDKNILHRCWLGQHVWRANISACPLLDSSPWITHFPIKQSVSARKQKRSNPEKADKLMTLILSVMRVLNCHIVTYLCLQFNEQKNEVKLFGRVACLYLNARSRIRSLLPDQGDSHDNNKFFVIDY